MVFFWPVTTDHSTLEYTTSLPTTKYEQDIKTPKNHDGANDGDDNVALTSLAFILYSTSLQLSVTVIVTTGIPPKDDQ